MVTMSTIMSSRFVKGIREEVEKVEGVMPGRYQVLETNSVLHILGRILSYLDPRSVKEASLVSR